MWSSALIVATVGTAVHALNNHGVAKLPSMGYDTFNAFACNYSATSALAQAKIMKERGLVELGYNIFILDDCYALKTRNETGYMVADPSKFPQGLAALNKQMGTYGVKLAAYGDLGYSTCAGYPGSWGHEKQDLETWHSWGMDYLKLDHCYFPTDNISQQNIPGLYMPMFDAINAFTKSNHVTFAYSLCEWGLEQPWVWGSEIAQYWRIDNDVKPWWSSIATVMTQASYQYWATGFYGHNDMDIMEVGNTGKGSPVGNLTYDESKSHFTAWALLKSPLIIGTDLTTASEQTFEILGNKDLIKINQDPNVGKSITPFRWTSNNAGYAVGNPNFPEVYWPTNPKQPAQYWSGNSSYGVVFMLLNTADSTQHMTFNIAESYLIRPGREYEVYDMWSHKTIGKATGNYTVAVPAHGVSALLLNDCGPAPASLDGTCQLQFQCGWPNGTMVYPNAPG